MTIEIFIFMRLFVIAVALIFWTIILTAVGR